MTYATKARTLDDIAADSHVFSIIAMDQRNTLRRMFTAVGLDASDDDLRVAKADVARVLTPAASGLLSDPTYGVPAITEAKALAPDCGLLVAAEPSERRSYQGEPRTHRDHRLAGSGGRVGDVHDFEIVGTAEAGAENGFHGENQGCGDRLS